MDETVLLGIGADNTENLFCASGYFNSSARAPTMTSSANIEAMFGANAPPIGSIGQSNYEGLRFLEAAADARRIAGDAAAARRRPRNMVYQRRARHRRPFATAARRDADVSRREPTGSTSADQNVLTAVARRFSKRSVCKIILEKENISVSNDADRSLPRRHAANLRRGVQKQTGFRRAPCQLSLPTPDQLRAVADAMRSRTDR